MPNTNFTVAYWAAETYRSTLDIFNGTGTMSFSSIIQSDPVDAVWRASSNLDPWIKRLALSMTNSLRNGKPHEFGRRRQRRSDLTGGPGPPDLVSQTQVAATLGYAGSFSAVTRGTFTSLPAVGQVIAQGQVLYEVDGQPIVLLYGATPAYRNLSEGESGPDVEELNDDLVALGEYSTGEAAPTSGTFDRGHGIRGRKAAGRPRCQPNRHLDLGPSGLLTHCGTEWLPRRGQLGRSGPGRPARAVGDVNHSAGQPRPRR